MAIFSGKVVSAKFIDSPNNMTIEVLYSEGDQDSSIPFILDVDFTQQDFIDLLEEITLEEIEANTQKQLEVEKNDFYSLIDSLVEEKWKEEEEKIKQAYEAIDAYAELKYQEVDAYAELKYQEVDQYTNSKYQEVDQYTNSKYQEVDQYADSRYNELDQYAEEEKLKKFEEVQEEFKQLRKDLQQKFLNREDFSIKDLKGSDLISIIESNNINSDFIFNMKITILEDEIIAKSKDKSLKLSIRKSKTLWQLLKIYAEIKEAS